MQILSTKSTVMDFISDRSKVNWPGSRIANNSSAGGAICACVCVCVCGVCACVGLQQKPKALIRHHRYDSVQV